LPTNSKRTSGSSRAASTNGSWPFWTSVPWSIAPTVSATRSFAADGSPNGSGTPWCTTVTRLGGIGVLRSISPRLYSELVIRRPARRMIQRLAQRRSPPCW
jgi:hypothetical protein